MTSYGTQKCAACYKRTQCPGKRYSTAGGMDKIRYLCQRDYCIRMRAVGRGKQCGSCGVRVFENMVDCWSCDPGGRKVSTEVKAASGTLPEPGSTPGYSTDDEMSVLTEDVQDLRDDLKKVRKELTELTQIVAVLSAQAMTTTPVYEYAQGTNPLPYRPDKKWY